MARPFGFIMDSSHGVKSFPNQAQGKSNTGNTEEQSESHVLVGAPVATGSERILPASVEKQDVQGSQVLKSTKSSSASRLTDALRARKSSDRDAETGIAVDRKLAPVRRVIRRHSSSSLDSPKKLSDIVEESIQSLIPVGLGLTKSVKPGWKSSSPTASAKSTFSPVASAKPKKSSSSSYVLDLSNANFTSTSSDPGNLDKPKRNNRVARNCTSDTNLINSRLGSRNFSGGNLSNYNSRARVSVSLVQRSSGQGAKELIETIMAKIDQFQKCTSDEEAMHCIPDVECSTLAHFAEDGYYRVVISASNGIPAVLLAMKTFPNHLGMQKACCTAISNLCNKNANNPVLVKNAGGISDILHAMEIHSSSIVVQSFACDALFHLKQFFTSMEEDTQARVVDCLNRAKGMYLMPGCREHAEEILESMDR
jgi:hypothetical protein|mmetsp:Transcript_5451/g.8303  ORF Transcript_5451/g.8303 Transcript_5451/m.8303 type:complete len:424 (-) Transcript_5451:438-1709(-)|eukprot:CAMPEP_0195297324 /NCGR_PEP_ID=MMETSP0707-20130614/21273_1 /TAXON_ID=33640 /ORGANISM="Asterionellopsis glacialis, Strain CCMP134" /LENGTH=423 /DNA_ID=CAMNT_0040359109 /DNA_START=109 /DNA_END=1380 /DNA_ORIENTATION=+